MIKKMFYLAILDESGQKVVEVPAGGRLQREFVHDVVTKACAKGVGYGKSQKHVESLLEDEFNAVINDLKDETKALAGL